MDTLTEMVKNAQLTALSGAVLSPTYLTGTSPLRAVPSALHLCIFDHFGFAWGVRSRQGGRL